MNATIDEFRIWNTARTMSDIYGGKDEAISNPAALNDLIAYLPMNLIEDNGETKVREYAMTNHAYFDNDNYAQATDVTILKGSKLSSTMSIQCENDSIEAGTPVKFHATSPLSTTQLHLVRKTTATQRSHLILYITRQANIPSASP